jgi:hypothetical protein
MNKLVKPPFQSVEIDLMDERLEAQAVEKGIPTLVSPKPEETTPPAAVIEAPRSAKPAIVRTRRAGASNQSTPRARMKTLNIEVPDYAWIEIKMRAAREMSSVRHVIMTALRGDGITINDADMIEDGRRLRGAEASK